MCESINKPAGGGTYLGKDTALWKQSTGRKGYTQTTVTMAQLPTGWPYLFLRDRGRAAPAVGRWYHPFAHPGMGRLAI
jgi:hypothetical protein